MKLGFKRLAPWVVCAGVVALALAGGIAYATIPDSGNVYTACMLKNVGTLRLIDKSLPSANPMSHCTNQETQVTWNQKGQPGEAGPVGPSGPAGKDGANGVSVTSTDEPAGANCPYGGSKFTAAGGNVTYACNGAPGAAGGGPADLSVHVSSVAGGSGTVTSSPGTIDCPGICTNTFANGLSVTLTANPASGEFFTGWSGDCSGNSPQCTLTINAAKDVTATFATAHTLTLHMTRPAPSCTETDSGIECHPQGLIHSAAPFVFQCGGFPGDSSSTPQLALTCSGRFPAGTTVTLVSFVDSIFDPPNWSGDCTSISGPICSITMDGDKVVNASY